MSKVNSIRVHEQDAANYDQLVLDYNCFIHDIIFGMSFDYVQQGQSILDLGIGTGLGSEPFAKLGLDVYGCDGSTEMLKVCEAKKITRDLKVFNIQSPPLPYVDSFFDHVICCGVFHFFESLESIVRDVLRLTKPEGIFAFSTAELILEEKNETEGNPSFFLKSTTSHGIDIFKHNHNYIITLLNNNRFTLLKSQKLLIRGGSDMNSEDMLFRVYITQKIA